MSLVKKLSRIFNRTVTHGGYIATSVALTAGIGIGVAMHDTHPLSSSAPVANVQMHDAEVNRLQTMADEILSQQYRIEINRKSVEQAQANLGKTDAKLSDQLAAVAQANEQNMRDMQAQHERLAAYRKEILFNNVVPEKEADHMYTTLFDKARDRQMGDITDFFSPFSDALTERDEVVGGMGLAGTDPQKISDARAESITNIMRSAATSESSHDHGQGLIDALEAAGFLFSLTGLGAVGRRREKPKPQDALPETVPAAAPPPAPEQDDTPPRPVAKSRSLSL